MVQPGEIAEHPPSPPWTVDQPGDSEDLSALLELLVDSEVHLGGYTDEELAVVAPNDPDALVPYPFVELLDDPDTRTTVLAAALRSLVARNLLVPQTEPGQFQVVGALGTALALRATAQSLLVVERVAEHDPTRWVIYGVGGANVPTVLEEAIAPLGHHDFTLRSVEGQATVLATELERRVAAERFEGASDEKAEAPEDALANELDEVLNRLTSVTRFYALRRDDDDNFVEIEGALADAENSDPLILIFQPSSESKGEHLLAVPTRRLPIRQFLESLLRFDLTKVNEALAQQAEGVEHT